VAAYSYLIAASLGVFSILMVVSCSPDSPLVDPTAGRPIDCEAVKTTYEDFGAAFFQNYCIRCHSVTREGDLARWDAPLGIDFDTLQMVQEFKDRIHLRAGELGDMPPRLFPVPRPSDEERIQLMIWIDCGMLSEAESEGD